MPRRAKTARFGAEIPTVGIDLVGLARAKDFLARHGTKARRLLSAWEKKTFGALSPLRFARIFAAKEAFFKATGGSWMGLEGFSEIEVRFLPKKKFSVRRRRARGWAEGRFFTKKGVIGAHVILWDRDALASA